MECLLCQSGNIDEFWQKNDRRHGSKTYWQCLNCSLVFLDPQCRLDSHDEKSIYDLHENSPTHVGYIKFLKKLADPLTEKLTDGAFGLDFGCGPGPTLSMILSERGYSVDNYDPYYFPDCSALDKKFDFVTCTEVIEHFCFPRKEFLLLDKLLKGPGSCLGLMTRIYEPRKDFRQWWYHRDPTHICFYQRATFGWIANWMGWTVKFPGEDVIIYEKL